jgi:3-methyl-2-oxobutanoate hydroxymethyltransferase
VSDKAPRYASWTTGKLPLPELQEMKRRGEKIVMVTAYDAPSGRLADAASVDLILVGDSSGMVMHGRESTVPVTLDEILFMTQWVTRGAKRAIVVADRSAPTRPRTSRRSGTRCASSRKAEPTR